MGPLDYKRQIKSSGLFVAIHDIYEMQCPGCQYIEIYSAKLPTASHPLVWLIFSRGNGV